MFILQSTPTFATQQILINQPITRACQVDGVCDYPKAVYDCHRDWPAATVINTAWYTTRRRHPKFSCQFLSAAAPKASLALFVFSIPSRRLCFVFLVAQKCCGKNSIALGTIFGAALCVLIWKCRMWSVSCV